MSAGSPSPGSACCTPSRPIDGAEVARRRAPHRPERPREPARGDGRRRRDHDPCGSTRTRRARSPSCSAARASSSPSPSSTSLPGVPIDWITVDDDDAIAGRRSATCPRHPVSRSWPSCATTTRTRRPPPTSSCEPATRIVAVGPHRGDRSGVPRDPPGRGLKRRRRGLMLQMMLRPRWVLALLARPRHRRRRSPLLGQWQLERAVEQAVVDERPDRRGAPARRRRRSPTARPSRRRPASASR